MSHLKTRRRGGELRTVPEGCRRLHREDVGDGGHEKYRPAYEVVDQTETLHCLVFQGCLLFRGVLQISKSHFIQRVSAWLRLTLSRLGIIQTSLASPLAAPSLGRFSTSRTASFCFSSTYIARYGFAEDWLRLGIGSSKLSLCAHLAQSLCILEKQKSTVQ